MEEKTGNVPIRSFEITFASPREVPSHGECFVPEAIAKPKQSVEGEFPLDVENGQTIVAAIYRRIQGAAE